MKRFFALFLAVMTMLLLLAACETGGGGGVITLPPENSEVVGGPTYAFHYMGKTIHMGDLWLGKDGALFPQLGEPVSSTASPSCAFQGLDKSFTYPGFVVKTYPDNDIDYVLSIQFTDDSVATPEGIRVGSSEADLTAAYGAGERSGNMVSYTQGKTQLVAVVDGGKVINLNYNYLQG